MNTYGPAVFFLVLTTSIIGFLVIVSLKNVLLSRRKAPVRVPILRDGTQFKRASATCPGIICMLPKYEQRRPEQPLW